MFLILLTVLLCTRINGEIVGLCYDQLAYDDVSFHTHGDMVDALVCRATCLGRGSSTMAPRQPDTCYCGPIDDSGMRSADTLTDSTDYVIPSDWPTFGSLVSSTDPIAAVALTFDTAANVLTVTITPRPGLSDERWTNCLGPCRGLAADTTDWETVEGDGIRYNISRSDGLGGPVAPFANSSVMGHVSICAPFVHLNTYFVVGTFLPELLAPPTPAPTTPMPPTPSDPPTTPVPTPAPTQPPTPAAVAHIGCAAIPLTMSEDALDDASVASVSACAAVCRPYSHLGLRNGHTCACLSVEPSNLTDVSLCDDPCDGAAGDSCAPADSDLLAIYRTGGPIVPTEASLAGAADRAASEGASRAPSDHGCFLAAPDEPSPPLVTVGDGWRGCTTACTAVAASIYAFANPNLCACLNSTDGWHQRTNEPPSCRQQCVADAARVCAVGRTVRLHSVAADLAVFSPPEEREDSVVVGESGSKSTFLQSDLQILVGLLGVYVAV
jgi:hypothetical protein